MNYCPRTEDEILKMSADQLLAHICTVSETIGYYHDHADLQEEYRVVRASVIEQLEARHAADLAALRASIGHLTAELEKARADRWMVLEAAKAAGLTTPVIAEARVVPGGEQLADARDILAWIASHDTPESRNAVTLHIDMAGKAAEFMRKHP